MCYNGVVQIIRGEKIMDKKTLKSYIKKGKLLCIVSPMTTSRKLYVNWYVIKNNELLYIDLTTSRVIGMDRIFDCYLKLLAEYDLEKLSNVQNFQRIY